MKISRFCFLLVHLSLNALSLSVPKEHYYPNAPDLQNHPGHYPFISALTFRNTCDFIIDQNTLFFNPDLVKRGDTIYVAVKYLEWFEKEVHDLIQHPYILVSCNEGGWGPAPNLQRLLYDPKLAAWFCRNLLFSHHPKLFQIPMGQDLAIFKIEPEVLDELKTATSKPFPPKKYCLYMSHYPRSYGDRDKIVKLFENEPYCFSRNQSDQTVWHGTSRPQFYEELSLSQFTLSPYGLNAESVRTWEALVLDCIPIVEHTFLDPLYAGLPILIIHKWEEIDQPLLEKKYQELKDLPRDRAYFDYWHDLIKSTQSQTKTHNNVFSQIEATQLSSQEVKELCALLQEKGKGDILICKGFLSALHSLQLADTFLSKIFLYDPWLSKETFNSLHLYLKNLDFFKNKDKITILGFEKQFNKVVNDLSSHPVFLDLSYYRNGLVRNFTNFRHSLKQDLIDLYQKLKTGGLLCGNKADDPYVKEVLTQFSQEQDLPIDIRGTLWFLHRN